MHPHRQASVVESHRLFFRKTKVCARIDERLPIQQTNHSKALSKTSSIVVFRECSRLCKVLEVAFWLLSKQYSNEKSKGTSKEADSIAPSFFFFLWNSCTRARSQAYACTHALDQRGRASAARRPRFMITFSRNFPSVLKQGHC